MAAQQEFLEHCHPSKVDDLTKFALFNEKELGSKVMEIGETIDKSIHHDIINLFGTESILPKDTAKKGIFGVIPICCISFYQIILLAIEAKENAGL